MRPLLLLDVDGVLSPFGAPPPVGFTRRTIDGYQVTLSPRHRGWLADLSTRFEIVWATTWEHRANAVLSPLLGLPTLDVIEFGHLRPSKPGETRKLPAVARSIGNEPAAWIDDELSADAYDWAEDRVAPTLLLRPNHREGMTDTHVSELDAFARSLNDL